MSESTQQPGAPKSLGVTETERLLANFCERSFLKLWSYSNPFKDDGHELCDLLAVFGKHVFVFFDRENALPSDGEIDPQVAWNRWKRTAIDRQVKTSHGAERYIRSGRPIYLDSKRTTVFPLEIDVAQAVVHKIVVAHGAMEACLYASSQNVYGSLAITYGEFDSSPTRPFHLEIDKRRPVHVLDTHNLPILLGELDTVSDFVSYLEAKTYAVNKYDFVSYCGEEDLLAHYLWNYDEATKRHVIGPKGGDQYNGVMIGEGEWKDFIETSLYKNTKAKNKVSYFWDDLIQRTCQNSLDGTLGGNSNIFRGESAIYEMAKEPRFIRRALAEKMLSAVQRFPDRMTEGMRQVTFLPSFIPNVAYVLLQVRMPQRLQADPDYRELRQKILEIACGAAKNKFPDLVKVIGIGIEAPKFSGGTNAEDFILMPCEEWPDEMRAHYEELNNGWDFFKSNSLTQFHENVTEFVPITRDEAPTQRKKKVGRNQLCPCGSGKKFKNCHIGN